MQVVADYFSVLGKEMSKPDEEFTPLVRSLEGSLRGTGAGVKDSRRHLEDRYLCATTVTIVHYLTEKVMGAERANKEIGKLLGLFEIAPVNRAVLLSALQLKGKDFEDAVVCEAAAQAKVQGIVTRDARGLKNSKVPIFTPDELTHIMRSSKNQAE